MHDVFSLGIPRTARFVSAFALALSVTVPSLVGCGGATRSARTGEARPLEQVRAIEVIRATAEAAGLKPGPSREIELVSGKKLTVDVSIEGKPHGFVYLTDEDEKAAGTDVGACPKKELRILSAGPDLKDKFVVLYQSQYKLDDLEGESHEESVIAAEAKLKRDVKDFIAGAQRRGYL